MRLALRPRFLHAALRHHVAAAVEHLQPIRLTRAETLLDIGANKGQFSLAFRNERPDAEIIAFEPLPGSADTYERAFAGDDRVVLQRVAVSDQNGAAIFFVADRDDSSSLLPPGDGQAQAFGVHQAETLEVETRKLEDCVALSSLKAPVLMKIDVQGAELKVLEGCADLSAIDYVYVELSYTELYEGQPLFDDVASHLAGRGFVLAGVFNQVLTDRFGPTQADFLFSRVSKQRNHA